MEEKVHVLLVDDEPDYLEPMSFWLRTKGYLVSIAPSGEKAIQIIKEESPHIVFLDIKMPGMDGVETLKHIREINEHIPVVMVTAYSKMGEFFMSGRKFPQAEQLKISGLFSKDKSFEELQNAIQVTLRKHKKLKGNS